MRPSASLLLLQHDLMFVEWVLLLPINIGTENVDVCALASARLGIVVMERIGTLVVQRLSANTLARVLIYYAIVPAASVSCSQTSAAAGVGIEQLVLCTVSLRRHWAVALAGGGVKLVETTALLRRIRWALRG